MSQPQLSQNTSDFFLPLKWSLCAETCVPRVDVGTEHGAMITLKWSLISSRVFLFPSKSQSLPVPSLLARVRSPHGHVDITFAGCIVAGEHGIGGPARFAAPTE